MNVGGTPPTKLHPGLQKPDDNARLRKTATQMEGLFVQKMFAAMRETVNSDDGFLPQSSAEGNFTQMLDEKFSEAAPAQFAGTHSIANALYNQLRRQLPGADTTTKASDAAGSVNTALHPTPTVPTAIRTVPASASAPAKL
jgi:flagellar protein FlgJ